MANFLISFCLLTAVYAGHATRHARALWVWHSHPIVQDAVQRHEFFKFLEAPKGDSAGRISVIFVSRIGVEDQSSSVAIASFIAEAHHRSVRVDYLCGDESYILPAHLKDGLWQLEYVLKYNHSEPPGARFDGIQFDVEPYALPGWPSSTLTKEYLGFLADCRDRIRASRQHVKLGAAIPRWFDVPELHGLYKSVLDRVDYVAVMDYVDKPASFVNDAKQTVEYASKAGKEAWLGAEASELPEEPHSTFYRLGNKAMEHAFQAAYHAFDLSNGFAGVAVEYYETYVALRP
jgi:hypothetical protein